MLDSAYLAVHYVNCRESKHLQPRVCRMPMTDRPMYRWRSMTDEQRDQVRKHRRENALPRHSPPHYRGETGLYLLTAACFEHRPVIGVSPERMAGFEIDLLKVLHEKSEEIFAWIVLPNHYHGLVRAANIDGLLWQLGRLHGRTSYDWNGEENGRGRQV